MTTAVLQQLSTTAAVPAAALLALGAAVLLALAGWRFRTRPWVASAPLLLLALVGITAGLQQDLASSPGLRTVVVCLTAVLAVAGGGPATTAVFRLVDGPRAERAGSVLRAAEILRGGAWIGALERAAVYASIASGWPEGIAVALAIKGLGRYPELRHEERAGIAERFLIGTFVSVLWAAGCAGVALLLVR